MAARSRSPWMPAGWRLLHQQLQRETVGVAAIPGSCHGHRFQFFKRYRSPNIVMAVASISAVGLQLWYMMTRQIISSSCNGLYALPNIAQPERRPSRVDWVEAGAVSRAVRHQNSCRCCWAMVVVAAIEALHYIKTKESLLLSVQELIDCDTKSFGCAGGYTENALEYVQKNGLSTESDYGYMSRERILGCKKNKALAASITGFKTIINPTEESLEEAVVQQPVIVRLQCSRSFDEYKGGIIDSPPAAPNSEGMFVHYVLIVGYDMDSNGVKFWRFKNTAGKGWGRGALEDSAGTSLTSEAYWVCLCIQQCTRCWTADLHLSRVNEEGRLWAKVGANGLGVLLPGT